MEAFIGALGTRSGCQLAAVNWIGAESFEIQVHLRRVAKHGAC
jgi:hypothetical protein